jgi:hypothetical protein
MVSPAEDLLDLQRTLLDASRQTAESAMSVQNAVADSLADGVEIHREFQRRLLGSQYARVRGALRESGERIPGPHETNEVLARVDTQVFDIRVEHEQGIDAVVSTLEGTARLYEAAARGSIQTLDWQLRSLLATVGDDGGPATGEDPSTE